MTLLASPLTETSAGTTVDEAGSLTDTYTAVLDSEPTEDVTVDLTLSTADITIDLSTLTFTTTNWNTPQTVTVTGVDDDVSEIGDSSVITHTLTSDDTTYSAMGIATVNVSINDNDSSGVTIVESGGSTISAEGGKVDAYTVVLTSEPTENVRLHFTNDDQVNLLSPTFLSLNNRILQFTPDNWDTAQTVRVQAVDDDFDEGPVRSIITHEVRSKDEFYKKRVVSVASVRALIQDDDSATIELTQPATTTLTTSQSSTASYSLVLTSQPTSTVTITMAGTSIATDPASLEFNATNWNVSQSVQVYIPDDAELNSESTTLVHTISSTDANYRSAEIPNLTFTLEDDEVEENVIANIIAIDVPLMDIPARFIAQGATERWECQWSAIETAEISNPNSCQTRITPFAKPIIVTLTVSSGESSHSATLTLQIRESEINTEDSGTRQMGSVQDNMPGGGKTTTDVQHKNAPDGVVTKRFDDGTLFAAPGIDKYFKSEKHGDIRFTRNPSFNNGHGQVCRIDTSVAPKTVRSWVDASGVRCIAGATKSRTSRKIVYV